MINVVEIKEKTTGKKEVAVYAQNKKGNFQYHVNGKPMPDKEFDKKYEVLTAHNRIK